jgi:MFS family permease
MVFAVFVLGACAGALYPAVNVLANTLYGPASLARALGLFTLMTLPLTFLLPPAMGVLHDWAKRYEPVVITMTAVCAIISVIFYVMARVIERRRMSTNLLAA